MDALLLLVLGLLPLCAAQELVMNPGFESGLTGHWEGLGCTVHRSNEARTGHHGLICNGRTSHYNGPGQIINVVPGKLYNFTSYVKQLNDMPGKMFQKYRVNIGYTYDDSTHPGNQYAVMHTTVQAKDGWFRMAAVIRTPSKQFIQAKLHFQTPDVGIDFVIDDVSLTPIEDDPNLQQKLDQSIENTRKGDIHLSFTLPPGEDASNYQVKLDLTKHEFGWGTVVQDRWMFDTAHKPYQDMLFDWFNTGTTQGVKWRFDKGTQDHPDFSQAMATIDLLREKGMTVRAHNLLWGFEKNLPQYVLHMPQDELNRTVEERIHYMMNLTYGKADHWDIMNELIHGQWFEEKFDDPRYSERVYREARALDPKPKLFLNDFAVVGKPEITDAYLQQAKRFLADGAPLDALGLQSHFHDQDIDPQLLWMQLDRMSEAGLPLWVTELDVWQADLSVRADNYEKVLRTFLAHPSVKGVVFWGFWDQHVVNKLSALVDGDQMTINEAGKRFVHLTKEVWSTHVNRSLSAGSTWDVRGFKGDYSVTVTKDGAPVKVEKFTLSGDSANVNINVDGNVGE